MAGSFNDNLAKGLGVGNTVVGFIMVIMASLLPLGIFSEILDFHHYVGLKIALAVLFSLFTLSLYIKYVRELRLSPIVWGFGSVMSIVVPTLLLFVAVDVILKILGLE